MLRIWKQFTDKSKYLDLNLPIKNVYAANKDVKLSWVQDPAGLTIQEWIDKCCDKLEEEGYDLQETSIEFVKDKFVNYDISVVPPKEYTQLQEALEQAKKTLALLSKFEADKQTIAQIESTISLLTSEMKELS